MALHDIKFANRRSHRMKFTSPAFSPKSPQVMRTSLSISPTGAAVAIRPPRTAVRRMDSRGAGTVGTF